MISISLIGYLADDPKSRSAGNSTVADFRVGCRSARKDKQGEYVSNFFSVTAFGHLADFVINNAKKGTKVYVSGAFADMDYTKKDGTAGHSLSVTATDVDIAYLPKDNAGTQRKAPQATAMPDYDGEGDSPF